VAVGKVPAHDKQPPGGQECVTTTEQVVARLICRLGDHARLPDQLRVEDACRADMRVEVGPVAHLSPGPEEHLPIREQVCMYQHIFRVAYSRSFPHDRGLGKRRSLPQNKNNLEGKDDGEPPVDQKAVVKRH
jgi:hypothetical protein